MVKNTALAHRAKEADRAELSARKVTLDQHTLTKCRVAQVDAGQVTVGEARSVELLAIKAGVARVEADDVERALADLSAL